MSTSRSDQLKLIIQEPSNVALMQQVSGVSEMPSIKKVWRAYFRSPTARNDIERQKRNEKAFIP